MRGEALETASVQLSCNNISTFVDVHYEKCTIIVENIDYFNENVLVDFSGDTG